MPELPGAEPGECFMNDIDFSSEFGKHAALRLESEIVIWLTTIGGNDQPNPNPVWFIWRNNRMIVLSYPTASKVKAIQRNPKVALSFNSSLSGDDVMIFNGIADAEEKSLDPMDAAAFLIKYRDGIERLGSTPEKFAAEYSRVITIDLHKLRGFV